MKQFALLRHAKSDWSDHHLDDFDRPLNERGREAARAMAPVIAACGFERVLASTARRVRETAAEAGIADVSWDESIYGAGPDDLLTLAGGVERSVERLLVVGHNPTMHHLARALARREDSPARHQLDEKYPTCALVVIGIEIEDWSELRQAKGVLERFVRPKDL